MHFRYMSLSKIVNVKKYFLITQNEKEIFSDIVIYDL
jgi:hypothetical protein